MDPKMSVLDARCAMSAAATTVLPKAVVAGEHAKILRRDCVECGDLLLAQGAEELHGQGRSGFSMVFDP